jgi:hypothetical protein
MVNLRKQAEADLAITLEGDFGLPVELIAPDGVEYTGLTGQVIFDRAEFDPESGAMIQIPERVVTLRISSLTRVPLDTDSPKWACSIPLTPDPAATLVKHRVEHVTRDGRSIGFVRLHLTEMAQS